MTTFVYDADTNWKQVNDPSVDWKNSFLLVQEPNSVEGYVVPRTAVHLSEFLTGMFSELSEGEEPKIPCQGFERPILYLVAKYMSYFGTNTNMTPTAIPRPYVDEGLPGNVFEQSFATEAYSHPTDLTNFIGVLNVSNFLQLNSLLDLTCAVLSMRFRGKTPKQIKEMWVGQRLPSTHPLA